MGYLAEGVDTGQQENPDIPMGRYHFAYNLCIYYRYWQLYGWFIVYYESIH